MLRGTCERKVAGDKSAVNLVLFVVIVGAMDITGTPLQREIVYSLLLVGFAAMRVPDVMAAPARKIRPIVYPRYPVRR